MPDTPLRGLEALKHTQEIQTHESPVKRLRVWGLVAFAAFLILWEIDTQYGGVIFAYLSGLLTWTMGRRVFVGVGGVLVGHYCWPRTLRLLPRRGRTEMHSEKV